MRRVITKHIMVGGALLVALVLGTGCRGPKEIPDSDLVNIFHDAFLANAYLDEHYADEDSLAVYEPIFRRYGYSVEDVHYSLKTFSERKSARLSDLVDKASKRLDEEQRAESYKIMVLDTIDRIAQRTFTRTMYSDSLIHVRKLADTSKLQIRVDNLVPGKYSISFDYHIDSLDKNRNSRVEVYLVRSDSSEVMRHTAMLSRYRESKYSRDMNVDSSHKTLCINMFYHPRHEKRDEPDIKIRNLKVIRVLPANIAVDSLYEQQLNLRIFNHRLMTSFVADTIPAHSEEQAEEPDTENNTPHPDEPQDSIALRADR